MRKGDFFTPCRDCTFHVGGECADGNGKTNEIDGCIETYYYDATFKELEDAKAKTVRTFVSRTIPKTIHYCWFGGKEMPETVKRCIFSWGQVLPREYTIKRWDETNYDVTKNKYIKEAYDSGNFAFVSDYARFDILHQYGGVYLDTDVLLIKDITPLLERGAFGGLNNSGQFASGLAVGGAAKMPIFREFMAEYEDATFLTKGGDPKLDININKEEVVMERHGYKMALDEPQMVGGLIIYPKEVFCPYDPSKGETKVTENTFAIHQFTGTWMPDWMKENIKKSNPKYKEHYDNIK